jgi:hypothetical protein
MIVKFDMIWQVRICRHSLLTLIMDIFVNGELLNSRGF